MVFVWQVVGRGRVDHRQGGVPCCSEGVETRVVRVSDGLNLGVRMVGRGNWRGVRLGGEGPG